MAETICSQFHTANLLQLTPMALNKFLRQFSCLLDANGTESFVSYRGGSRRRISQRQTDHPNQQHYCRLQYNNVYTKRQIKNVTFVSRNCQKCNNIHKAIPKLSRGRNHRNPHSVTNLFGGPWAADCLVAELSGLLRPTHRRIIPPIIGWGTK